MIATRDSKREAIRALNFTIWACLAGSLLASAGANDAHKATLFRDTWGTPHVYAETLAEAAYAMGYAQAEDRLEDIYKNVRIATGTLSEVFGPQFAERDYIMRLVGNDELCKKYWTTAPSYITELGDNFMRGVEAYVSEYPDKKPPFAVELHGWQCAAIQRAMMLNWPLETVMRELSRKDKAPSFGSNAFAIGPSRSAEGCPIFLADPHLTWEGMELFYEGRMHAGNVDLCGFWMVGTPLPAVGHSGHVAWAYCVGGPDTADVYMVKLNPQNPLQYQYNGEWREFDVKMTSIAIKDNPTLQKPMVYSLYGPVIAEPDTAKGIAYCGASPYFGESRVLEQLLQMVSAKNCSEFYQALSMLQLVEVNVSFADTEGNIRYLRNGNTPVRPEGYNWSVPVPGGTEATRWKGIHKIDELVQMENPPQGYFVNCNISPENMMKESPMTPDKYKPYLYNVTWDYQTPRGARLVELIDADSSVTKDEAMKYALDVYDISAKPWQKALREALDAHKDLHKSNPDFARAVSVILGWDGFFTRDSKAGPYMRYWRLKCEQSLPMPDIAQGKPLSTENQSLLLDKLDDAVAEMKKVYGTLDITWGDINLIGRNGKYFACPGAEFGGGGQMDRTETVMDVDCREEPKGSGKFVGVGGSHTILLTLLHRDGIESYSILNWGQSADPASPHHVDQAQKLYAERTFKPTWFKKEDLLKNVESEKELTF
ncbi:MAG: penicillin acylase family protein [Candidatus Hydrogenedentes bacterium]|nr:penicillin acylase family protein [Candidatus Hydrogenedentota bacterium]